MTCGAELKEQREGAIGLVPPPAYRKLTGSWVVWKYPLKSGKCFFEPSSCLSGSCLGPLLAAVRKPRSSLMSTSSVLVPGFWRRIPQKGKRAWIKVVLLGGSLLEHQWEHWLGCFWPPSRAKRPGRGSRARLIN